MSHFTRSHGRLLLFDASLPLFVRDPLLRPLPDNFWHEARKKGATSQHSMRH
jgi:hypothetical protein